MGECCENCTAYFKVDEGNGVCRAAPPKVFLLEKDNGEKVFVSQFPPMKHDGWCRSYLKKEV